MQCVQKPIYIHCIKKPVCVFGVATEATQSCSKLWVIVSLRRSEECTLEHLLWEAPCIGSRGIISNCQFVVWLKQYFIFLSPMDTLAMWDPLTVGRCVSLLCKSWWLHLFISLIHCHEWLCNIGLWMLDSFYTMQLYCYVCSLLFWIMMKVAHTNLIYYCCI